jgi:hypothetical protein
MVLAISWSLCVASGVANTILDPWGLRLAGASPCWGTSQGSKMVLAILWGVCVASEVANTILDPWGLGSVGARVGKGLKGLIRSL